VEETAFIMDGEEYENKLMEGAASVAEKPRHQGRKADVVVESKALPGES